MIPPWFSATDIMPRVRLSFFRRIVRRKAGGTVIKPNPGEIATGVGNGLAMSTMTPVADRLHIGNAWIGHSGLNLYDNTARLHDPIMVRYHNPDPLAYIQGQISPYTHCNANPANLVDRDGRNCYKLDSEGNFTMTQQNDDLYDVIYSNSGKPLVVPKEFFSKYRIARVIPNGETMPDDLHLFDLSFDGFLIFEFLANNTNVEWSYLEFEDKTCVIGTTNRYGSEGTAGYFDKAERNRLKGLVSFSHTHTGDNVDASDDDVTMAQSLDQYNQGIVYNIYWNMDFLVTSTFTPKTNASKKELKNIDCIAPKPTNLKK